MQRRRLVLFPAAMACLSAHPAEPAQDAAEAGREDAPWPESPPELLQVDAGRLAALERRLVADHPAIRSLLIARRGALAFEHHGHGLGPASRHDVHSVTKSVVSLLVGIALGQGLIRGTGETLADFFGDEPALQANPPARRITLADLLTLTPGFDTGVLDRDTDYGDFLRRFHGDGLLGHALARPVAHPPGTRFHYSNLDAHLVSLALARRAGTSVAAYARQHLFAPLGIADADWPANLQGDGNGASGLRLRARDMAKLGQLVLQQGRWNGRQVVPSDYVARATRRQVASDLPVRSRPDLWGYGYLWWTVATLGDDLPACYASGYGGQFIYVVPALDLVVVATTDGRSRSDASRTGAVIRDHVLPAVRR